MTFSFGLEMNRFIFLSILFTLSLSPSIVSNAKTQNPTLNASSLSTSSSAKSGSRSDNPLIRIGIIQHLGRNYGESLQIKVQDPKDKIQITFPEKPCSINMSQTQTEELDLLNIKVVSFPIPFDEIAETRKIKVGSFTTYEDAYYAEQVLKDYFPEQNWQVYYPRPWEVWTLSEKPHELMRTLTRKGFHASWIKEKPLSKRTLSWQSYSSIPSADPKSEYQFNRNKVILQSKLGKSLIIDSKTYPGIIEITPDSFGTFSVINELPIENYLRGVVPLEIGADSPRAALETQAILARTYALANLNRYLPEGYNLCSTQKCQVYGGLSVTNKRIDNAIDATTGIVLKDKTGSVVQALYSSTDGGYTANFDDIWFGFNNSKSLMGVSTCSKLPKEFDLSIEEQVYEFLTSEDAKKWNCFDVVSPHFRWTKEIDSRELARLINEAKNNWKFNWVDLDQVTALNISKRSKTGRIIELIVQGSRGESLIIPKDKIRAALGLKSTFFVVDKLETISDKTNNTEIKFSFRGSGYGHGVGLSQFGARNLANQGKNAKEIIKIYFPNYELAKI